MKATLLPSKPQTAITRRLSLAEYFHASAGKYAKTVARPNEGAIIFEGLGTVPAACWRSDGPAPRLRTVADCRGDDRSAVGAEHRDGPR